MTASAFMRDLLDRDAQPRSGETILDVLRIGVPMILGGIAPIAGPLSTLLDQLPGAARVIRCVVPIVLVSVCVHVIRKKRPAVRSPGFDTAARYGQQEYGFGQPGRIVAKFALLPLVALALFQAYSAAPNWLLGRRALSGYICRSDGAPVEQSATVYAVDIDGHVVTREAAPVDDNGFFVIAYRPWARRASAIEVDTSTCGKRSVPLSAATPGIQCAADTLPPPSARSTRPLWLISCAE